MQQILTKGMCSLFIEIFFILTSFNCFYPILLVQGLSLSAGQGTGLFRKHWFIENADHHVRDVTLREDYSRIRVKPENMSTLRSFALNIFRKNKINNINDELYQNSLNYNRLYGYQQFI